ncbi:MAG: 2-oxoglutarate oxidoreductase [Thermogladius sp.]|nr:2-oxoglutarate oxidoreductase [Thermogladius sp.]
MRKEILIVGRGGQGVLLLGRLLGLVASRYMKLYTSASEHYTSETRGGESRVDMVIADKLEEVYDFAGVSKPYLIIILYPYNIGEYLRLAREDTYLFIDKTFYQGEASTPARVYALEYTRLAEKMLNDSRVANILLLGHVLRVTGIMPLEYVKAGIGELLNPRYHELNFRALEAGFNLPG